MESRNPVLSRRGAVGRQPGHAPSAHLRTRYDAPSSTPQRSMTIDDVVRSFVTPATLVVAGALAWVFVPDRLANAVALAAGVAGLIFWALVTSGRKVNAASGATARSASSSVSRRSCLYLLLDFGWIEDGVRSGARQKTSWLAAFGLTLSLIWIYLEMLRFLPRFDSRGREPGRALPPAHTAMPPRYPPRGRCWLSAVDVRAGAFDRHANQHPAVAFHGLAVLVPVRVFTRGHPVVVDQRLHGVRQAYDLGLAVDLCPFAEEGIGEEAERHSGIAEQIAGLGRGLTRADDDPSLVVDRAEHRRRLGSAVGMTRDHDRPVVFTGEVAGSARIHRTALEANGPPVQLVLVHQCDRVTVGKSVLVGQPVDPLVTSEEGGAVVYGLEPLGEVTSCDFRDACDEILVRLR